MTVYVVTAHRWGEDETHNYIVGVWDTASEAIHFAERHEEYRGGKYGCRVSAVEMGQRVDVEKLWPERRAAGAVVSLRKLPVPWEPTP